MTTQSEQALENLLLQQLVENGYSKVTIKNEADLVVNLKAQLERFNNITLTDTEFKLVLNHLTRTTSAFEKAKILRDRFAFKDDNNDTKYIRFLNTDDWCENEFQVTNQVTMVGDYENRYDVTILINGLPLVQIELKRRGVELKKAFDQIVRYHKHTFGKGYGLFEYVQIFVISNGANSKYYTYSKNNDFKFTFYWTDEKNNRISDLEKFAQVFLDKCHISKMITRYIVLHETDKQILVLRPYQCYAVEKIVESVKNTNDNGFIWHTTGSGKTLTSFKASQILTKIPKVDKVVFCVDRKDLDTQTTQEFNAFSNGSVDSTTNTKTLVKQLTDINTPLIVTTIQKLNTAVSFESHQKTLQSLKDKKVIFIFDECHRSQFGDTHKNIVKYFHNHQLFGFTGTPIFNENALSVKGQKLTTYDIFHNLLHDYVITDAISDNNVLPFSIEYVGKYKYKNESRNNLDIEVEDIDTKELFESQERIDKISNYIIQNHSTKTKSKQFNAIFCISNTKTLIKYFDTFRRLKNEGKHDLKIATIFSYEANEEAKEYSSDYNGDIEDSNFDYNNANIDKHTRDILSDYIEEYNAEFVTNFSIKATDKKDDDKPKSKSKRKSEEEDKSFDGYYKSIASKVKNNEIDILFVVNMFLTGFDAPTLNTLYVDKNLKYHGLIQAFSRTNRLRGQDKSHGQIVSFRNLKTATDTALELFSNKKPYEHIQVEPLDVFVDKFNDAVKQLLQITPLSDDVDTLKSETQKLNFVKAFRVLIRLKNRMETYADFSFDDLLINEFTFNNFASKYEDLKREISQSNNKDSILNDVDFQLELLHKDEVNVDYILNLIANIEIQEIDEVEKEKKRADALNQMYGEPSLRSKRDLIEKFISEQLKDLPQGTDITEAFSEFMNIEKVKEFNEIVLDENVDSEQLEATINRLLFTGRFPTNTELVETLKEKPSFRQFRAIGERLNRKLTNFVDRFLR